eukprot:scaffold12.g8160.t1
MRPAAAPSRLARASGRQTVLVRASVKPPQGVSLPTVRPEVPPPLFGFVENAERLNSRVALLGFLALLLVEVVTGKGVLELIGISVSQGV